MRSPRRISLDCVLLGHVLLWSLLAHLACPYRALGPARAPLLALDLLGSARALLPGPVLPGRARAPPRGVFPRPSRALLPGPVLPGRARALPLGPVLPGRARMILIGPVLLGAREYSPSGPSSLGAHVLLLGPVLLGARAHSPSRPSSWGAHALILGRARPPIACDARVLGRVRPRPRMCIVFPRPRASETRDRAASVRSEERCKCVPPSRERSGVAASLRPRATGKQRRLTKRVSTLSREEFPAF